MDCIAQNDEFRIRSMQGVEEDFRLYLKWMTDPQTMKYWDGMTEIFTYEKVVAEYQEHLEEKVTQCIIEYKGAPIGYLQFYRTDAEENDLPLDEYEKYIRKDELAYGIDIFLGEVDFRDCGIGTRCMQLITKTLFEEYKAQVIIIDPKVHNTRAIRCYEKAGFRKLFVVKEHELQDGIYHDNLIMAMRREDLKL